MLTLRGARHLGHRGLVGSGIGYLTVHETDIDEPWRNVVCGAGIGALSGGGLGLGLGLLDAGLEWRSATRYVMRDTLYGSLAGGLFGSAIGGLVALSSDDAYAVLAGGSIGAISGAALGLVAVWSRGSWARTAVAPAPSCSRRCALIMICPGVPW